MRAKRSTAGYVLTLGAAFLLAVTAGWTPLASQIDRYHYDWMFRLYPAPARPSSSLILAFDERSLMELGGVRRIRTALAKVLARVAEADPKVVAIDVILSDRGDAAEDAALRAAMTKTQNLILSADLIPGASAWEEPIDEFRPVAKAIGHVHADPDRYDGVSRQLPLEKAAGRTRRWALALEAYRLAHGGLEIIESPGELQVGRLIVPSARTDGRPLWIRYSREPIDTLPVRELLADASSAARLRGKTVFIGVTAQSAARDRLVTPLSHSRNMPGVEIHAHAFETLERGQFLRPAPEVSVLAFCLIVVALAGIIFYYRAGWLAYGLGALLLGVAHAGPHLIFQRDIVFPYFAPISAAWLSVAAAASYQHFVVRRQLRKAEGDKARYQQAIHFVTHEMRTPLTAIQGSSELIGRYNLTEEKRKQIAGTINSESKRLARMIQTFLDVERLSEGQLELKREPIAVAALLATCVDRARPLADRKRTSLLLEYQGADSMLGDRELMEYAFYNLITNAIKYSPPETQVRMNGRREGEHLRLSVSDQGIGMDEKELKKIFTKFYRTKRAEASGEVGTGIGLSIVQQIVTHHGGRIEVTSAPGKGSCFTVVLPAQMSSSASPAAAEQLSR